jgi:hypothetical protein
MTANSLSLLIAILSGSSTRLNAPDHDPIFLSMTLKKTGSRVGPQHPIPVTPWNYESSRIKIPDPGSVS